MDELRIVVYDENGVASESGATLMQKNNQTEEGLLWL